MRETLHREAMEWALAVAWRERLRAGPARVDVVSPSMTPMARVGDAFIFETTRSPLRIGDVALVITGGRALAHRVVAVHGSVYFTKGDRSPSPDPGVAPDAVLGYARGLVKEDGRFINLATLRQRAAGRTLAHISRLETWCASHGFRGRAGIVHRFFYLAMRAVGFCAGY